MSRAILIIALAAIVVSVCTLPGHSRSPAYVGIYPDETMVTCGHLGGGDPFSVAYVVVTNAIPLQEITFRAPVPECLGGPDTFLAEYSPFATTGNSQTGITVYLGGCTSTFPVTVLTIYYTGEFTGGGPYGDCCAWDAFDVEFVDCDEVTREGGDATLCWYVSGDCETFDVLGPYDPYPADGATGVPTDVTLSWKLPQEVCDELFYLGTHPNPNTSFYWPEGYYTTWDPPELLAPNTTYYWRPRIACEYDDYFSWPPTWSFTTGEGPLAAEETTWGRIKALYE
jgi:hypothetical protein